MIRRYIYIIFLCLITIHNKAYAIEIPNSLVEETLKQLDSEIANREKYIKKRETQIDSLKKSLINSSDQSSHISTLMEIGDKYIAFNNDSAITYFEKGHNLALKLNSDSLATAFSLKKVTYLPLTGFIHEAVSEYEAIDSTSIPNGLRELYFESGKQMYAYISSFYSNHPEVSQFWHKKSINACIALLNTLDKDSKKHKLFQGEYFIETKEYNKAKAILENALDSFDDVENLYARTSYAIASIASTDNNLNEYIYYLALSSIADIKSSTLEIVSMQTLGETLLKQGDINRAHKYSSIALDNAIKCKANLRIIQSSEAMSVIEQSHTAEIEDWRDLMSFFNICIGILSLILILLLIYLRRKTTRLSLLQERLQHANNLKEVYISQFLSLCSIYMDKLNQFSNIVNRKLSAGKVDDIYKITQSGKFIEELSKDFYNVFDDAFLNIYPTFITSVNSLLMPDKQIILLPDEKMNTDLRILALMRLGIEDSSRIAQMLNYSVNTIYTYRNKLKNKAIDRDKFEENIMKIPSIS